MAKREYVPYKGGLRLLSEERDAAEYKAEPTDCPRWYRRVTRMYPNRKLAHKGEVFRIGTELLAGNREYTTCVKVEVWKTTWRR